MITFGGFFIFEVMQHLPIHPVQYFLVGLGLAIFFLLLISFSEHMAFGAAYLLASAGCIGLLTFYLTFVLRSLGYGLDLRVAADSAVRGHLWASYLGGQCACARLADALRIACAGYVRYAQSRLVQGRHARHACVSDEHRQATA